MLHHRIHALALLAFCILGLQRPAISEQPQVITIGALASLTGPAAEQGRNWLEGAMLAAEELSSKGQQVQLKVEDDQTTPARVPGIVRKLVSIDGAQALIGGTWDYLGEAAYPVVLKMKVPYITPTNPPELLDGFSKDNPYIFTNGLSLKATESAIRSFLISQKPESISIVVPKVTFGVLHGEMLQKLAAELNIRVTARHDFDLAGYQETLRSLALKIARVERPALVFCLAEYSTLDLFVSQLETQKFFPLILNTQHLDQAIILSGRPERYSRAFGLYPQIKDPEFSARYSARFGHPPRVYSANGYDAVNFLVTALRAGTDLSKPGFEYRGILGAYKARADTRALLSEDRAVIMGLKDGKFVEYREG